MRVVVYRFTGRQGPFHVPERWCEECDLTVRAAERVAAEFPGVEVEVKPWLVHLPRALLHGVWHPPAVVVDGRRVAQGEVPSDALLRSAFREALARRGGRASPGARAARGASSSARPTSSAAARGRGRTRTRTRR